MYRLFCYCYPKILLIVISTFNIVYSAPNIEILRYHYSRASNQWPKPEIDSNIEWQELSKLPEKNRALSANPNDPMWDDVENSQIVALGAYLFSDKRLSKKQQVSCLTCHNPARSFTDGQALAIGEDGLMGTRRSMTLFGAVGAQMFFWDGRATSLNEQVLASITNPREMNFTIEGVLARLNDADQKYFTSAFGKPANTELLIRALTTYIANLRPPTTKFDTFLEKNNDALLTDQEIWGLHLFRTKARCMNCHSGPLLTDQNFHNIGLSFAGRRNQDLGRYEITRLKEDVGKFRTPSLRGISAAGPWMHNGLFPTLKGVITMYSAGMPNTIKTEHLPFPVKTSEHIKKLDLSAEEIDALLKFLNIL